LDLLRVASCPEARWFDKKAPHVGAFFMGDVRAICKWIPRTVRRFRLAFHNMLKININKFCRFARAPKVRRNFVVTVDNLYKGKPVVRRGRKASGLAKDSGVAEENRFLAGALAPDSGSFLNQESPCHTTALSPSVQPIAAAATRQVPRRVLPCALLWWRP
jgi:hypothetical protein